MLNMRPWRFHFPQILVAVREEKLCKIHLDYPSARAPRWILNVFLLGEQLLRAGWNRFCCRFYWSTSLELWNKHTPSWNKRLESMKNYLTARFNFMNSCSDRRNLYWVLRGTVGKSGIMDVVAFVRKIATNASLYIFIYVEWQHPDFSPVAKVRGYLR